MHGYDVNVHDNLWYALDSHQQNNYKALIQFMDISLEQLICFFIDNGHIGWCGSGTAIINEALDIIQGLCLMLCHPINQFYLADSFVCTLLKMQAKMWNFNSSWWSWQLNIHNQAWRKRKQIRWNPIYDQQNMNYSENAWNFLLSAR